MLEERIRDHSKRALLSHQYAQNNGLFIKPIVYSHELIPILDYQIAQDVDPGRFVYFGSLNENGLMPSLITDVQNSGTESPFYGTVFCPVTGVIDRSADEACWHPYKNMAFWAGAIDAHRAFYLTTDIAWYYMKGNPNPATGTCVEILWLLDNGYTAFPDRNNPKGTIFIPAQNPAVFSILKYDKQDAPMNTIRLSEFIRDILRARTKLERTPSVPFYHVQPALLAPTSQTSTQRFFSTSTGSDVSLATTITSLKQ